MADVLTILHFCLLTSSKNLLSEKEKLATFVGESEHEAVFPLEQKIPILVAEIQKPEAELDRHRVELVRLRHRVRDPDPDGLSGFDRQRRSVRRFECELEAVERILKT
jgi:hypothetical protein